MKASTSFTSKLALETLVCRCTTPRLPFVKGFIYVASQRLLQSLNESFSSLWTHDVNGRARALSPALP